MSKLISLSEEEFLGFLLRAYYQENKTYLRFINFTEIQNAVNLFLFYFQNEDRMTRSTHLLFIKKIFSDSNVTHQNCNTELGICKKTFYRYKRKYLEIFKSYLVQCFSTEKTS